jgi:hypothetical protein
VVSSWPDLSKMAIFVENLALDSGVVLTSGLDMMENVNLPLVLPEIEPQSSSP